MKENSREEDIKILKELGQKYYKNGEIKIKALSGAKYIWALQNILSDYKRVLKENEQLKEYILIAPNLDEMTATKYRNIQQDAYIQGRVEEQQKAEQIIYESYISKQIIKDKIEELKEAYEDSKDENGESQYYYPDYTIRVMEELLEKR